MKTLYTYQTEARDAVIASDCGQVIAPTGTGKSKIQGAVIEFLIRQNSNFGIYVILTPRILLTNQLMTTVAKDLVAAGITNIKTLTVHSGNAAEFYNEDDVDYEEKTVFDYLDNKATVSSDTVALDIQVARVEQRPMLICCTYDSVPVLLTGLTKAGATIKQTLCDEAHFITERTNNENLVALKSVSNRTHFFTATRKLTNSNAGLGMNNEDVFGKVIFKRTPKEMIDAGYIVPPLIHSVLAGKETSWSSIIMQSYEEHTKYVAGDAKMLVCCNGTKSVEEIRNNRDLIQWATANDVAIFSVTSKHGAYQDAREYEKRDEFLKDLREHTGKAIVLHIAILTEGIDVPDMSGVLFIRNMRECRFNQSLGRALRVLAIDKGVAIKDRVKKYAYAICVDRIDDGEATDQYTNLKGMVRKMCLAGFEATEIIYSDADFGDDPQDDGLEDTNDKERRSKAAKTAYDECVHEIEADHLSNVVFEIASSKKSYKEKAAMLLA